MLTWAYYLGYLNSINAQDVGQMTYSTADNSLAQTSGIYDPENANYQYDTGNFTAVCEPFLHRHAGGPDGGLQCHL